MIKPEQCRSARAWLDWSQEDLAAKASVALSTIRDFEKGRREPIANNLEAIERAFAEAGVVPADDGLDPTGIRAEPRIKERETYLPALRLLNEAEGGFLKTSDLIRGLERVMAPEGEDAEILEGRADTRFTQIVRNIVSHRNIAGNMIHDGLAEYDGKYRGLRITEAGRNRVASGS